MRVICIDGTKLGQLGWDKKPVECGEEIQPGIVYTVVHSYFEYRILWYYLKEKPSYVSYNSDRFVPLSDIDESKFERKYQKQ